MSCSIGSFTMGRAASRAVMILTTCYLEFFKEVWACIPCNGLHKNTDLRKSVITLWCGDSQLSRLDVTNLGTIRRFCSYPIVKALNTPRPCICSTLVVHITLRGRIADSTWDSMDQQFVGTRCPRSVSSPGKTLRGYECSESTIRMWKFRSQLI